MNPKFFNTAGPCRAEDHYMLDPLSRLKEISGLIDQKAYFVLHAPRQTGKTTALEALAKSLTLEGKYTCLKFSCERGQPFGNDIAKAELSLLQAMQTASEIHLPPELQCPTPTSAAEGSILSVYLTQWAKSSPRPLVLFFDEIDALREKALESVLRQLRDGYSNRPHAFPHSIILCGLRDVRDYKILSGSSSHLSTSSPFNIKTESLLLPNFTASQVRELYLQHTQATGQMFEEEAFSKAWELTEGQPWLVNALAREVVQKMGIPATQNITSWHMEQAAQNLILARQTHLDSLVDKLKDERVKRVVEPILAGKMLTVDCTYDDDVSYVRDLGLISLNPPVRISNPIYREVVVRVLSSRVTDSIELERLTFVKQDGLLDVGVILSEFMIWWKRHGEIMLQGTYYSEAAAQLVFMAWLQRVVNGGGLIDREYGVGRGRMDVLVRWPIPDSPLPQAWQYEAFELKVWADRCSDPLEEGLEQLDRYLSRLHLDRGTLVIFDRRSTALPPSERTSLSQVTSPKGYRIHLLRG